MIIVLGKLCDVEAWGALGNGMTGRLRLHKRPRDGLKIFSSAAIFVITLQ